MCLPSETLLILLLLLLIIIIIMSAQNRFLFCAVYRYKYACYENNTLIRLDKDQLSVTKKRSVQKLLKH